MNTCLILMLCVIFVTPFLVTPCRYSYDYGMVHMVMLSTEHDYRPGSPQYQWLENDLKSVDRSKTPFVMVGGHRPMYCSEESPGTLDIFFMMSSHSVQNTNTFACLLYTSPSPRDKRQSRMPSSA